MHPRGATRSHSLSDSVDSTASTVAGDAVARTEPRAQSRGDAHGRGVTAEGGGGDPLIAAILRRAERLRGEVDAVMGGQGEEGPRRTCGAADVSAPHGAPAYPAASEAAPHSVSDSMDTVALDMLVDNLDRGGDEAPLGGGASRPALSGHPLPTTAAPRHAAAAGGAEGEEDDEERWLGGLLRELSPAEHAGFPSLAGAGGSALEALPSVYAVRARASSLVVAPTRPEDERAVARDRAPHDAFASTYGHYRVVALLPSAPTARCGSRTRRAGPHRRPWEAESSSDQLAEAGDDAAGPGSSDSGPISAWEGMSLLSLGKEARVQTAAERAAEREAHSGDSRAASALRRRSAAARGGTGTGSGSGSGGGGGGRQGCEVGEAALDVEAVCPLSFDDDLAARWVAGHALVLAIPLPAAAEDRTGSGGATTRNRGGARGKRRDAAKRGTRGDDRRCAVLAGVVPLRSLLFAEDLALSLHVAMAAVECGGAGVAARDALRASSEGAEELVRRLGRVVWQEIGTGPDSPVPNPCGTLGLTLRLMLRSHEGLQAAEAQKRRREEAGRREEEEAAAAQAARAQPRPWEAGTEAPHSPGGDGAEPTRGKPEPGANAADEGAGASAAVSSAVEASQTRQGVPGGTVAPVSGPVPASAPAPTSVPAPAPAPAGVGLLALWFAVVDARLGARTVGRAASQFGAGCAVRVCVAWKPCSRMGAGAACSGVAVQTAPVHLPRGDPVPIALPPTWETARWAGEVAAVGNAAVRRVVLQVSLVGEQAAKALLVGAVDLGTRPAEPWSRPPTWVPVSAPWEGGASGEEEAGALCLASVVGSPKAVATHALSRRRAAMRLVTSTRKWHLRRRSQRRGRGLGRSGDPTGSGAAGRRRDQGQEFAAEGHGAALEQGRGRSAAAPAFGPGPPADSDETRPYRALGTWEGGEAPGRGSSGPGSGKHGGSGAGSEPCGGGTAPGGAEGPSSVVLSSSREARERSLPLAARLRVEVLAAMDVDVPASWPSVRLRIVLPPCGRDGAAVQRLGAPVPRDRVEEALTLAAGRQVELTPETVQQLADASARIEVVGPNDDALGYCSLPLAPCMQQWGRAVDRWLDLYAASDAAFGGPGSRGSMVASIGALRVRAALDDADPRTEDALRSRRADAGGVDRQPAPPVEALPALHSPVDSAGGGQGEEGRWGDAAGTGQPPEPASAPAPAPRVHETLAQRVRRLRSGSGAQARAEAGGGESRRPLPTPAGWHEAPSGEGVVWGGGEAASRELRAPAPSPASAASLRVTVEQASGLAPGSRVYATVAAPWQGAVTARSDVCGAVRGKAAWEEEHALALPPEVDSVGALARFAVTVALWHRPSRGVGDGGDPAHHDAEEGGAGGASPRPPPAAPSGTAREGGVLGPTAEVVRASPQLHPRFGSGGAERHTVGVLPRDELVGVACVPLDPLCHGFASVHGWYLVQDASGTARGALLVRAAADGLGTAPPPPPLLQAASRGPALPASSSQPSAGGGGWAWTAPYAGAEDPGTGARTVLSGGRAGGGGGAEEGERGSGEEESGARGGAVCDAAEAVMRDLSAVHAALERRLYPGTALGAAGGWPGMVSPADDLTASTPASRPAGAASEVPGVASPAPLQGAQSSGRPAGYGDGVPVGPAPHTGGSSHPDALSASEPRPCGTYAGGGCGGGGGGALWTEPASWTVPITHGAGEGRGEAALMQGGVTAAADAVRGLLPQWESGDADSSGGEGSGEGEDSAPLSTSGARRDGEQREEGPGATGVGDRAVTTPREPIQGEDVSADHDSVGHSPSTAGSRGEGGAEEPPAAAGDDGPDGDAGGAAVRPLQEWGDDAPEAGSEEGLAHSSEGDVLESASAQGSAQESGVEGEGARQLPERTESESVAGESDTTEPPFHCAVPHGPGERATEVAAASSPRALKHEGPEAGGEAQSGAESPSALGESVSAGRAARGPDEACPDATGVGGSDANEGVVESGAGGGGLLSAVADAGGGSASIEPQQHEEPVDATEGVQSAPTVSSSESEGHEDEAGCCPSTVPKAAQAEDHAGELRSGQGVASAAGSFYEPTGMAGHCDREAERDREAGAETGAVGEGNVGVLGVRSGEAGTGTGASGLVSTHYNTLGSDPRQRRTLPDAHAVAAQESAWRGEESERRGLHDSLTTSESSSSASGSVRREVEGANTGTALDAETRRIARILRSSGRKDAGRGERSVASSLLFYSSEDDGQ